MNRPELTLLEKLQHEYALTDTGIAVTDITWTELDWSQTEMGARRPYVIVKRAGATRDQPVELMFDFTFIVQVVWWYEHVNEVSDRRDDVWKIVEALKKIVGNQANLPDANWHSMRVERDANVSVLNVLPDVITENLTVIAKINWSDS